MDEYRAASLVLGKKVTFIRGEVHGEGIAESIDDSGFLKVRRTDGGEEILSSGEISIRLEQ